MKIIFYWLNLALLGMVNSFTLKTKQSVSLLVTYGNVYTKKIWAPPDHMSMIAFPEMVKILKKKFCETYRIMILKLGVTCRRLACPTLNWLISCDS